VTDNVRMQLFIPSVCGYFSIIFIHLLHMQN